MISLGADPKQTQPIPRLARVITYNRDTNMTSEWLVGLTLRPPGKGTRTKSYEGRIISQDLLKDVQVLKQLSSLSPPRGCDRSLTPSLLLMSASLRRANAL